jgi:hypothetical protein
MEDRERPEIFATPLVGQSSPSFGTIKKILKFCRRPRAPERHVIEKILHNVPKIIVVLTPAGALRGNYLGGEVLEERDNSSINDWPCMSGCKR